MRLRLFFLKITKDFPVYENGSDMKISFCFLSLPSLYVCIWKGVSCVFSRFWLWWMLYIVEFLVNHAYNFVTLRNFFQIGEGWIGGSTYSFVVLG